MKAFSTLLISIIVSGCSTTGFSTADHNGLMYYFPENCSKYYYSYSNPNELHCLHNGELTGQSIYPASQEQISNYRSQQDELDRILKGLPKTTYTNCYKIYGGSNCTSTTY